ncbi:NADH-quinone oxidoreductase subunit L [Marinobacter subterrani]|uniref:Probable inorganic carbon transporter subunit DabB n=1 Tax=Marinobacter subterrani TaxID=1658765 RepID=A0A0J7J8M9_9GAMM|nr:NADH-quinone oxidoreductase subunit L [Marinobacter subterrani]KMQ74329.1 NADH-Ubiquinone/plastoquinone (complex I) [Marinobacter subterrani]
MNPIAEFSSLLVLAIWLIVPVGLFVLAGLSGWLKNPLKLNHCWRLAGWMMVASMAASLMVALLLVIQSRIGGDSNTLVSLGSRFGLYPDGIAVWMALMVAFIGWVILRFADNYLSQDPGRDRFLPWFLVTVGSVLVLVFTNHLLTLAGAWIGVSLALHHLLTLYQDRPQARMAAVQKFIVSRVGDALVISGVVALYLHYGTFYLPDMIQSEAARAGGSTALTVASVVLALAAALKCAQIPFHGWLIRVMEAPTPVSALLHAGVINLGGFLWLRLFPVFDGFTAGHMILLVVGGMTAVVAVLTMMTQYSVKHALAWSTCAQMGFMLFEIGMGAYTLALLHLLAHSLYKAHSFLASGRTVVVSAATGFPEPRVASRLVWAGSTGLVAAFILFQAPGIVEHNPVFGALLVLAVAAAAMGIPTGATGAMRLRLAGLAVLLVPLYSLLHLLLGPAVPAHEGFAIPAIAYGLGLAMIALLASCSLLILFGARSRLAQALRAHFRQGLYLELPFDRLTRFLAAEALKVPSMFRRVPHHPFRLEEKS